MADDDLRARIAKVLYTRTMSRLSWHRNWDDLQPEVQQMWLDDADAVIAELNLATACESGCVWQIPRHVEDMTHRQRELLRKPPLFGQHLAVGEDGPIMLNISPKDDDA